MTNFSKALCISLVLISSSLFSQSASCDLLQATVEQTSSIACPGGNDGELTVAPAGGTEPYQVLWSTGEVDLTISGLSAGVYSVNVIDANDCLTISLFNLTEPELPEYEVTAAWADCGLSNGSITINEPAENGPYQYALNGGSMQSENVFQDLPAGVYAVNILNGLGCSANQFVTVTSENSPEMTIEQTADISCFADCSAEIEVNSPADDLVYTWYSINANGETEWIGDDVESIDELCAGNYFVCAETVGVGGMPVEETFWTEDFGNGCNQGQLAQGFNSDNGVWTVTQSGSNGEFSNTFFISATEQIGADNCGTGCGGENNRTLHISNVAILWIPADGGALYVSDFASNVRAESPVIDCSGHENIELSFDYIEYGQGDLDNATLWYFDGNNWSQLDDPAKTACCGGPCNGSNQGSFTSYSIQLPVSANFNPNVRIGFNWTNNADSQGSDPSFAVDNIELKGLTGDVNDEECAGCSEVFTVSQPDPFELFLVKFGNSACFGNNDGTIQVQPVGGASPYEYLWDNDSTSSVLANLAPGFYTITVTDQNGCSVSETYEITEPDEEWVAFEYFDLGLDAVFINNSSGGSYLWDFGDGTESTDANPTHTYDSQGEYEVCLTLLSDCGDLTTCQNLLIFLTGQDELESLDSFNFFPNPVKDVLWFFAENNTNYSIRFFNSTGQMVHELNTGAKQSIDISHWESGVYFYMVSSDNTPVPVSGKILKAK